MANFKKGNLIGIKKENGFYYYLILSKPMFFGCQWTYAFHQKSEKLLSTGDVLSGYGEGFHALIDFKKEERSKKNIFKISGNIDTKPYQVKKNSKVRIDKPDGGHVWYIFNTNLQILREQKNLKDTQVTLPIASGITCGDAQLLIDKKWKTDQVVEEEGRGQFPI